MSDHEYVRRVAAVVDERMRRISSLAPTHDALKIAVLAALNIADELQRVKDIDESDGAETTPQHQDSAATSEPPAKNAPGSGDAAESQKEKEEREESRRSWFEDIFDSEPAPRRDGERLSSLVSEKLRMNRRPSHEGLTIEAEGERD